MSQDKNLTVKGAVEVAVDGDKLVLTPRDALVCVSIIDDRGIVLYCWHPLSGWYTEQDMRREKVE